MSNSESILDLPGSAQRGLFELGAPRTLFEASILPSYIPRCRWFSGKARDPRRFVVRDMVPIDAAPDAAQLTFVDTEYADGTTSTWLLPLQLLTGPTADELISTHPEAILARFADGVLCDALHDGAFRTALFGLVAGSGTRTGERGTVVAEPGPALNGIQGPPPSRAHAVEQSNSSIIYGESIFLKVYRRIEAGRNPDAEILRFLGERGLAHVPPYAGSVEYREANGPAHVLALATGLVPNHGDAWGFTLRELGRWFTALRADDHTGAEDIESQSLARAAQLGTRTGELHLALASEPSDPEFAPEPLTAADGKALAESILSSALQISALITTRLDTFPEHARELANRFLAGGSALRARAETLGGHLTAAKIRTHGDYHLGQVLETGGDFVIIDFEGEPLRSLPSRREKRSPFRDVAGMQRSFDYAAHSALESQAPHRALLAPQADQWSVKAQRAFLESWRTATHGAPFRAATPAEESQLLEAFLLEKALYEIFYEINNRPTWLPIPLRGVLQLLEKA